MLVRMLPILPVLLILVTSAPHVFAIPFSPPDSDNVTATPTFPYESSEGGYYVNYGNNSRLTKQMDKVYDRYVAGTRLHLIIRPSPTTYIFKKNVYNTIIALRAEVSGHGKTDPITHIISFPPAADLASFDYMPRVSAKKQVKWGEMEQVAAIIWNLYLYLERSIYWVGMLVPMHVQVFDTRKGMLGEIWITDAKTLAGGGGGQPVASVSASTTYPAAAVADDGDIPTS